MFVNTQKGSSGMFSKTGRNTLEKFQILLRKDEIINGINKKMKVNDFYTPDDPDDIDNQEDEFKINSKEEKNNLIDKTINKFKKKIKKNVSKKSKHSSKINNNRIHENPPCNKYNPNWEYGRKKLCWGSKWGSVSNKKNALFGEKEKFNNQSLGSYRDTFIVDTKSFVNFEKQSKRPSFSQSGNDNYYFNPKYTVQEEKSKYRYFMNRSVKRNSKQKISSYVC